MKDLTSLLAIQKRVAKGFPTGKLDEPTARRLWWAALDTLQEDILMPKNLTRGLWIAAPLPACNKTVKIKDIAAITCIAEIIVSIEQQNLYEILITRSNKTEI